MINARLLIICSAVISWPLYADTAVVALTIAQAGVCVAPTAQCNSTQASSTSINSPLPATIDTTLAAGTGTATVAGSGQSTYGILHSSASESFSGSTSPVSTLVFGFAEFIDVITISSSPFTGSTGDLHIGFNLDGTNSRSGSLDAKSFVFATVFPNLTFSVKETSFLDFTSSSVSGKFYFPETFKFVYGQPFGLSFQLSTEAGTFDPGADGNFSLRTATAPGTAESNFNNTFVLSALQVVDSQGNPVNGVTFSSESGTRYSIDGVVPEPSYSALLAAAFVSLGAIRRRLKGRKA